MSYLLRIAWLRASAALASAALLISALPAIAGTPDFSVTISPKFGFNANVTLSIANVPPFAAVLDALLPIPSVLCSG